MSGERLSFLLVSAADRRHLLPLTQVREILPMLALQQREERRGRFQGAMNLRGEIVPVLCFAENETPVTPAQFIVVLLAAGRSIGVVVDEVHDLITLPPDGLIRRELDHGDAIQLARIGNELLSVTDVERHFHV